MRWRQERPAGLSKRIDDGNDVVPVGLDHPTNLPQLRGTPDDGIVRRFLGETGE